MRQRRLSPKALDPKSVEPKAPPHFSAALKALDPKSSHQLVLAQERSTCPSSAYLLVLHVVSLDLKAFLLPLKASVSSVQGGPLTSLKFVHSHPPLRMASVSSLQLFLFVRCLPAGRACEPFAWDDCRAPASSAFDWEQEHRVASSAPPLLPTSASAALVLRAVLPPPSVELVACRRASCLRQYRLRRPSHIGPDCYVTTMEIVPAPTRSNIPSTDRN